MKVAFFSNFLSHYQVSLSLAMQQATNDKYTFVATEKIPQDRLSFGFEDLNSKFPFVLAAYESVENEQKAMRLALESDYVIIGSAPEKYAINRIQQGKLTFRYHERRLKKGLPFYKFPLYAAAFYYSHRRFSRLPMYMLCASAYTAADYAIFKCYLNKTYKWGYFSEVKKQNITELFARKNANCKASIVWAGRLIDWKHPEAAIELAQSLRREGCPFKLNIIGNGELEGVLRQMIAEKGLEEHVSLLGAMHHSDVRRHMEEADIFIFTSDFNEGWGVVLNEAMNSACAVVASHAIGSVPFLIKNEENGLIYPNGNQERLNHLVKRLIKEPRLRYKLGCEASKTLTDCWNPNTAAQRFLALAEHLKSGETGTLFKHGPCSRAAILKNDWFC